MKVLGRMESEFGYDFIHFCVLCKTQVKTALMFSFTKSKSFSFIDIDFKFNPELTKLKTIESKLAREEEIRRKV